MNEFVKQPRWKVSEYSKGEINRAGKLIRTPNLDVVELENAIKVIDNWRAAHAYPMHVIYTGLRQKFGKKDGVIVAERLKRLDSIIYKLQREEEMQLWRMQDLGGCRVIVPTVQDVFSVANKYKDSSIRHKHIKTDNYIDNPKRSGYRGIHMIYQFHSDKNETYNRNMLIEIQIRTHLQHLWATTVETMGLFTKESLKSGEGSNEVKRFFVLVSSLFALKESTPLVPDTIDDIDEIISEIEYLNSKNNFLDFLSGIRVAVEYCEENIQNQGYYILILNYNSRNLRIKYYKPSEIESANKIYTSIESTKGASNIDAVLVRVSSFKQLKSAYPNYFSDIGEFVDIVKSYLN